MGMFSILKLMKVSYEITYAISSTQLNFPWYGKNKPPNQCKADKLTQLDKNMFKIKKVTCKQTVTWPFHFAHFEHVLPTKKIIYTEEMCPILSFCRKHFWPIGKLTWLDKNIFHWSVETGIKYFTTIINYYCPLVLSAGHNWELLIAPKHRPLCYKKIRTTTTTAF